MEAARLRSRSDRVRASTTASLCTQACRGKSVTQVEAAASYPHTTSHTQAWHAFRAAAWCRLTTAYGRLRGPWRLRGGGGTTFAASSKHKKERRAHHCDLRCRLPAAPLRVSPAATPWPRAIPPPPLTQPTSFRGVGVRECSWAYCTPRLGECARMSIRPASPRGHPIVETSDSHRTTKRPPRSEPRRFRKCEDAK